MTETLLNQSEQLSDKESTTSPSTVPTKQKRQLPAGPGRPKGSKNRITAAKLGIEEALRDQLHEYMPEVLNKAIDLALKGDRAMLKLLLELTISKAQAVEDVSEGKDKVQVTIRRLNIDQASVAIEQNKPEVIDVTPAEVIEYVER